jgi:hypothetical protein
LSPIQSPIRVWADDLEAQVSAVFLVFLAAETSSPLVTLCDVVDTIYSWSTSGVSSTVVEVTQLGVTCGFTV